MVAISCYEDRQRLTWAICKSDYHRGLIGTATVPGMYELTPKTCFRLVCLWYCEFTDHHHFHHHFMSVFLKKTHCRMTVKVIRTTYLLSTRIVLVHFPFILICFITWLSSFMQKVIVFYRCYGLWRFQLRLFFARLRVFIAVWRFFHLAKSNNAKKCAIFLQCQSQVELVFSTIQSYLANTSIQVWKLFWSLW